MPLHRWSCFRGRGIAAAISSSVSPIPAVGRRTSCPGTSVMPGRRWSGADARPAGPSNHRVPV